MRIFDCFPVVDGTEMIRARVYELRRIPEVVHLAIELNLHHRGQEKPFHIYDSFLPFEPEMWRLRDIRRYAEPSEDPWVVERHHREAILEELEYFKPLPYDLVLVSDVDEIVRADALLAIAQETLAGPVRLGMRMHYYSFQWHDPNGWAKATAFRWADRPETLESLRMGDAPVVPNAGWHLSYFMDADRIHEKLRTFAHSEYDTPEAHGRVDQMLQQGIDIHGKILDRWDGSDVPGWFCRVDNLADRV